MGKLTSFLGGAAGGFMSGSRMKKQDEHNQKMDEIYGKLIETKLTDSSNKTVDPNANSVKTDDEEEEGTGMANGGMVGELPIYADRYGWQRQNFKK
jgi:hypothetical protein